MDGHLQAKLLSRSSKLLLPDYPFSLPATAGVDELNALVLELGNAADAGENKRFDFLVNGILLRVSLDEFVKEHELSKEDVLIVECISQELPPKLKNTLSHSDWVSTVKTTSDLLISGCYDNTIQIWSLENQKNLLQIAEHNGPIKALCVCETNDDSMTFASGSHDQSIMLWKFDKKSRKASCVLIGRGHERSVECLCSSRDGKRLASGSFDNLIKIWNLEPTTSDDTATADLSKKFKSSKVDNKSITRTPMVTLSGHREVVSAMAWTDDAEIVTCSWDRTLALWDLELAGQKSSLACTVALTCLSYSPLNKLIITGSADPHIRLWDPRNKTTTSAKAAYSSHNGWIVGVEWSKTNENLFASASYDKLVKLWDMRSFKVPLYDLTAHDDRALCCDWSNEKYVASGGVDSTVRLYSFNSSS